MRKERFLREKKKGMFLSERGKEMVSGGEGGKEFVSVSEVEKVFVRGGEIFVI